jgi:YHS domain-containing protein
MVLDPQCHSYVPKSDAVFRSGQYFCSQECARLYLAR